MRNAQEKFNSDRMTRSMRTFDELIREFSLKDPPLCNGQFTWSNFRQQPVCCQLDRFLVSISWEEVFPYFRQEMDVRTMSDHCPIILDSTPPSWGSTLFRFENMWLHHKSFNSFFAKWWKDSTSVGWEGHKFMSKLKLIKEKVKSWNQEVFGDIRLLNQSLLKRIKELDVLEASGSWNNELKEERFTVKSHFERILIQEERATRMKSKIAWAKDGDANTKLLQRLMNARKAKNVITILETGDGNIVDKEDDIVREITEFFKSLYQSAGRSYRGIEGIEWQPIPSHLAEWLERPFEETEVKKAIFDCDGSKAPGPDGFTLELFQTQ